MSAICSLIFYNLPLKAYVIVSAIAGIILAYVINKKLRKFKMNIWTYTIIIGVLTFLSRYLVTAYANTKTYSETTKKVLSYVPSAVFPSLIFPAVFYENNSLIFYSNEVLAFSCCNCKYYF